VVFPVKYRKTLLDEEVTRIIMETEKGISERYDIEFEQIGCDSKHIHLLCSAHPELAPGQIVRAFKSLTSRETFRRKPEVKRRCGEGSSGQTAIMWQQ
jgi:putative transposase